MQVDRGTQLAQRERRALDVPSRPAGAPQRLPRRFVVERRLPQDEVEGVALVGIVDVAAPICRERQHLVARVVRHRAEVGERVHVEVHRATGLIRVAAVEHHPDEAADVGDGRRCARLAPARQQIEGQHVGLEARCLGRREIEVVHTERAGLGEDGVVDVGDVAHALRVVAGVA